jgi:N-acetylneuraminic acid mutarotase
VDARNSGGTIIASGCATINVSAGNTAAANVTVAPITGTGALQITLQWAAGAFVSPSITASLTPKGGTLQNITFTINENTATYQNNELPAGYYTLSVYLYDGGVFKWGGAEAVRIISGQTASGIRNVSMHGSEVGTVDLEVNPDLQSPIGISFSGQSGELQLGQQMTVTATPAETVDSYQWYLNGWRILGETGSAVTVGSNLTEGNYRLDLVITKGDIVGSESLYFAVFDNTPNRWVSKANLIYGVTQCGSAAVNGKIYVPGGGETIFDANQEYNPITNTWSLKANLPMPIVGNSVVALNDLVYIIGGRQPTNYGSALTYAYDPATNTYTQKDSLNQARHSAASAVANNKIYIMGGNYGGGYLNQVEEYNPDNDTWTTKTNMPTARANLGAATVNGKIYAFGGYSNLSGGDKLKIVEEYDPVGNSWRTLTTIMPVALQGFAIEVVNNKIYLMGGYTTGVGAKDSVYEFDPATETWQTKPNMPEARYFFSATAVNGRIYSMSSGTDGRKVFQYIP